MTSTTTRSTTLIVMRNNNILIMIMIMMITILFNVADCHYIKKISRPLAVIEGYINQQKQYPIPFSKCFKVEPELQANSQFMNFLPSSLTLQKLSEYQIREKQELSLLDSLRSSLTYKHKAIVVLEDYVMLLAIPNKILILSQQPGSSTFELKNSYRIQQLKSNQVPFKLYKYSQNLAIMIIQNHKAFYLLDNKGYRHFQLPSDITLSHLEPINEKQLIIAEHIRGLGHYRLNENLGTVDLIRKYRHDELGLEESYIVDVNVNHVGPLSQLYLLDAKAGLIKMDFNKEKNLFSNPQVIVKQSKCEAFDSISENYFVMLCQLHGFSSIIQVYQTKDEQGKSSFETQEPTYHSAYFKDIQVSNKFYMVYSNKLINVFWNTKLNHLPTGIDSHSQINIPGLETFKLKTIQKGQNNNKSGDTLLYTVENGFLNKYSMKQSKAKLSFHASQQSEKHLSRNIQKSMNVLMYGSCQQIGQFEQKDVLPGNGVLTCQIKQKFNLMFSAENYIDKDSFSISASIIILLVIIFLVIIWICLKKYKGLQNQARKILDNYQKKKGNQRRAL